MTVGQILSKEKIVSFSELQKNPAKALDANIVRIVKNGKEMGIFLSKAEFEDLVEESLALKPDFKKELYVVVKKSKKGKLTSLKSIL